MEKMVGISLASFPYHFSAQALPVSYGFKWKCAVGDKKKKGGVFL